MAASGTVTFPKGSVEQQVPVTVLADPTPRTEACWYQDAPACSTFSLAVNPITAGVTVSTYGTDAILQEPTPLGLSVYAGDGFIAQGPSSKTEQISIPVSLSALAKSPVSISYSLSGPNALPGITFTEQSGTLNIPAGAEEGVVTASLPASAGFQPFETFYLSLSAASNATIARDTGVVTVATPAAGTISKLAPGFATDSMVHVVTPGLVDRYALTAKQGSVTVAAEGKIAVADDRSFFFAPGAASSTDQQSCASWSSQSPAPSPTVPLQQGLVLRAATFDGVTKAISVTKNIVYGVNWVFNVHEWNSSLPIPYVLLHHFDLSSYVIAQAKVRPLPWNACLQVVGSQLRFELWVSGDPVPAWGDSTHGGDIPLPSSMVFAGTPGYYAGHLTAKSSMTFSQLYAGAPTSTPLP